MSVTLRKLRAATKHRNELAARVADADARRDRLIHQAIGEGARQIDIAAAAELSKQRVHQIVRARRG